MDYQKKSGGKNDLSTVSIINDILADRFSWNFSDIGPKVLLEPVLGLGTGYQFVKAAATAAERRQRIATLASFLAASGGSGN